MPRKIVGYNVYEAPEGAAESFLGFVETIDKAYALVERDGYALPEHLYATARAAGHCNGVPAPDRTREADEPEEWFGPDGYHCAVAVLGD